MRDSQGHRSEFKVMWNEFVEGNILVYSCTLQGETIAQPAEKQTYIGN